MTPRERMLTAMTGGIPDRVPASPDTNWVIPTKRTGLPFWDVFMTGKPPLWKAYNDCVRYFGVDGFSHHGFVSIPALPEVSSEQEIIFEDDHKKVRRTTFHCPAGTLTSENTYLIDEPNTITKGFIEDLPSQFECVRYLMGDYENCTFDGYKKVQEDMGDDGVVGLCVDLPFLMIFWRQPKESSMFDYYDHRDLLDEYMKMSEHKMMTILQRIIDLDVQPDFVFFPMSGLLTLQSEEIARRYSYPALKKGTKLLKEAGIVSSLHSCGKQAITVEFAANETDLDCIDPLEIPPMGDCNLRELKQKFGDKIALKGNLHTTDVMLRMDPEGVEAEARKCLDDAMEGGGYILSTGDQCGRETPDENIFKLVEVCEKYGKY